MSQIAGILSFGIITGCLSYLIRESTDIQIEKIPLTSLSLNTFPNNQEKIPLTSLSLNTFPNNQEQIHWESLPENPNITHLLIHYKDAKEFKDAKNAEVNKV
jgi:hypothetical protein